MGEGLEFVFWCLAIIGTITFTLKLIMLFAGFDHDVDHDLGDVGHDGDSTAAFNLLSIQSVSCLAMGTGWMGLFVYKSLELGTYQSWSVGVAFGLGLVFLSGKLMQLALGLESSGTLDLNKAVGTSGTVYLNIPATGHGQIQIAIQGRMVTVDARSENEAIPTGTKVMVESVDSKGMLVVSNH